MPRFIAPDSDDEDFQPELAQVVEAVRVDSEPNAFENTQNSFEMDDGLMEDPVFQDELPALVLPAEYEQKFKSISLSAYDKDLSALLDLLAEPVASSGVLADYSEIPFNAIFPHITRSEVTTVVSTHRHLVQTLLEVHLLQSSPENTVSLMNFVPVAENGSSSCNPSYTTLSYAVREAIKDTVSDFPDDFFTQLCNSYFAALYSLSGTSVFSGNSFHRDNFRFLKVCISVFSLLKALFSATIGFQNVLRKGAEEGGDLEAQNTLTDVVRQQEVSKWCQYLLSPFDMTQGRAVAKVKNEQVSNKDVQEEADQASIYTALCVGNVNKAVNVAIQAKFFRLATLLSTVGTARTRELMKAQMTTWKRGSVWGSFSVYLRRIYALLAGDWTDASLWGSTNVSVLGGIATGDQSPNSIDERSPEQWSWVRVFALEVFYGCHSSVKDALKAFDKLNLDFKHSLNHPAPKEDILYSILQCSNGFEMPDFTRVFSTSSVAHPVTGSPQECILDWVLADLFCAYYVQNSNEMNLAHMQAILVEKTSLLCKELTALGLWPWGAYVVTVAPLPIVMKEDKLKSLLQRYLPALSALDSNTSNIDEAGTVVSTNSDIPVKAYDMDGAQISVGDITLTVEAMQALYPFEDAALFHRSLACQGRFVLSEHAAIPLAVQCNTDCVTIPRVFPLDTDLGELPEEYHATEEHAVVAGRALDQFLCFICRIPVPWLHTVRAQQAKTANRPLLQLVHLLSTSEVEVNEEQDLFIDSGKVNDTVLFEAYELFLTTLAVSLSANGLVDDLYAVSRVFFAQYMDDIMDKSRFSQNDAIDAAGIETETATVEVVMGLVFRIVGLRHVVRAAIEQGALSSTEETTNELIHLYSAVEDIFGDCWLAKPFVRHNVLAVVLSNVERTTKSALFSVNEELTRLGVNMSSHGFTHVLGRIEAMPYLDSVVGALNQ